MSKGPKAFRTISEVAKELEVPQHVLRFWETRFKQIQPMKRGGGRRYYRPEDVDLIKGVQHLLYKEGLTIRGVQRILKEKGINAVSEVGKGDAKLRVLEKDSGEYTKQDTNIHCIEQTADKKSLNLEDTPSNNEVQSPDKVKNIQLSDQKREQLKIILSELEQCIEILKADVTCSEVIAAE